MKTYILIAILILLVIYSFRGLYRNFTGKGGCSCGDHKKDGGCSCGGNCNDSNCNCKHDS